MKTTMVYITLVSLAMRASGKEFNLARWTNIIDPDSLGISDDCIAGNCNNPFAQKRSRANDEMEQLPSAGFYRTASAPWQWFCPCETQYGILDLGPENYPRYLASAHCVPKSCHNKFNQCKLIHYKVHVLRERELSDANDTSDEQYIEQSILPESLRVKWQLKPMKIAVACVAATEGRKN